ncbi:MAG: 4Fe-4S dicluster domain-containing protein [Deltaproteobacteria bacterium]|nr:4Fe-4S dicluster domain-containing protein [Deltaproteobacteria bacterium]MBW1943222.1 4Fe-4S dicluster domain-containing protein [Deltaproteobacteria bacterium]MBW2206859.1 4Fe-4S dicluster domain-containing protein [Deltaproteobacteria bacterium]
MGVKVNPNLMKELKEFGLDDANKCFHCGNCTAVCPLSTPENPFPRKLVRYAQMGLEDKILESAEPWLCYYCGDCSDRCPRGADPGETMMAMRRFLTSKYDWTGFARKFYTSETFEIVAVAIVGILVGLALWIFHADSPNMEHAYLNSVWPAGSIEIADLFMAGILTFLLLSNTWRCVKFVMGDMLKKIPLEIYIKQAKELVVHFITQKQFGECTDKMQWFVHLLIMTGYSTIFLMVAVFLAGGLEVVGLYWEPIAFQRDVIYPIWHPMRLLGYYATAAILYGSTYALIGRLRKSKAPYKKSHGTDWMFLVLLQLTALTGIFIHFTRLLDWPMPTYVLYVVHMMFAIPMLVLEVPFSKWAHLAYRPVVLFLTKVKEEYKRQQEAA